MDIQRVLRELKQKDADRKFRQDDANRLISLISLIPCHLDGRLLIIDLAWEYPGFFPANWNEYYMDAVGRGEQCWNMEGMVQIHMLAATLYENNQQTTLASQTIRQAFELAPQDWKVIDAYISKTRPILPETEAIPLIGRISELAPRDCLAFYRQGFLYERYANRFHKPAYKHAALRAYQQAITLGLGDNTMPAILEDAKGAFARLSRNS